MSVTLLVKLQRPLALGDLEKASSAALRELLNLDHDPVINARFDETDTVGGLCGSLLTAASKRVVCSLMGYEEKIAVAPFTVPVQTQRTGNSYCFADQNYVSVAWLFKKTSLCWALVAAVALAVAKEEDSEIEDNSGFFTKENIQRPDYWRSNISLRVPYSDLEAAAQAFYAKLPKSAEIADWLRTEATTDS